MATKPRLVLRRGLKPPAPKPSAAKPVMKIAKLRRQVQDERNRIDLLNAWSFPDNGGAPVSPTATQPVPVPRPAPRPAPEGYVHVYKFSELAVGMTFTYFGGVDLYIKVNPREGQDSTGYCRLITEDTRVCVDSATHSSNHLLYVISRGRVSHTGSMTRAIDRL